jgi:hypothetical protein
MEPRLTLAAEKKGQDERETLFENNIVIVDKEA